MAELPDSATVEINATTPDIEWIAPAPAPASATVHKTAQAQPHILNKMVWVLVTLIIGALIHAFYLQSTSSNIKAHLSTSAKINVGLKQELERLKDGRTQSQKTIQDYENKIIQKYNMDIFSLSFVPMK